MRRKRVAGPVKTEKTVELSAHPASEAFDQDAVYEAMGYLSENVRKDIHKTYGISPPKLRTVWDHENSKVSVIADDPAQLGIKVEISTLTDEDRNMGSENGDDLSGAPDLGGLGPDDGSLPDLGMDFGGAPDMSLGPDLGAAPAPPPPGPAPDATLGPPPPTPNAGPAPAPPGPAMPPTPPGGPTVGPMF